MEQDEYIRTLDDYLLIKKESWENFKIIVEKLLEIINDILEGKERNALKN